MPCWCGGHIGAQRTQRQNRHPLVQRTRRELGRHRSLLAGARRAGLSGFAWRRTSVCHRMTGASGGARNRRGSSRSGCGRAVAWIVGIVVRVGLEKLSESADEGLSQESILVDLLDGFQISLSGLLHRPHGPSSKDPIDLSGANEADCRMVWAGRLSGRSADVGQAERSIERVRDRRDLQRADTSRIFPLISHGFVQPVVEVLPEAQQPCDRGVYRLPHLHHAASSGSSPFASCWAQMSLSSSLGVHGIGWPFSVER